MSDTLSTEQILGLGQEFLMPAYLRYWPDDPLHIASAEGAHYIGADGKRYVDAFGSVVTMSVGHCNPAVIEAQIAQLRQLGHTTTLYLEPQIVLTAKRLAEIAPGDLSQSFFVNSGSEANEFAAHLAKRLTGKTGLIALRHSFHGRTTTAASLTMQEPWRNVPPYASDVYSVPNPYVFRRPEGMSKGTFYEWCLSETREVIRHSLGGKGNFAALWVEPIQGNGGVISAPAWYYDALYDLAHEYDGLLIADEVQTGFGRTGKWFGCSWWNRVPDMMVMAKSMGNGFPVGGVIAKPNVAAGFEGLAHFNTYGGNPVAMVTVRAIITEIAKERMWANITDRSIQLRHGLEKLQAHHRMIGDIRGQGLMIGIEIVTDRDSNEKNPSATALIHRECRDRGVILGKGGVDGNVFRIKPPYCLSSDDCDQILGAFDEALTVAEAA